MAAVTHRWIWPLGLALIAAAIAATAGSAQSNSGSGSLAGKLTDSYSTPLIGATVTVHNQATGAELRTTTTKNGTYHFTALDAGEYTLEADSPTLGRGSVEGIVVAAGHEARVQAAIELERPRRPPIQAALHEMEPAAQVVSTTLPAEQLQQLPLTGRHWEDFVLDTPAASNQAGDEARTSLRGAGQAAEVTMDGAQRTLAFGSTGATGEPGAGRSETNSAQAQGRGAGLGGPAMSQTALREVQIAAGNAEAEADRAAAGAMNVESRHGTNGLHGQAFFFDRQNSWGAQNPFTQWVQQTAPATELTTPVFTPIAYTPPDSELTFGAGVGGDIRRDKLFWFGAIDGYRRNDPGLATVKHPDVFFAQPSNDQMQVLSARLGLPSANPVAEGLAEYSQMLETLAGLLGPAPRTASQSVGFGRIDWQAAERHQLTLEGIGALWDSPGGGLTRVSETFGNHSFGTSHATEEWVLGRWQAFLTPNLLATTQGSLGRDVLSARPEAPSVFEQGFLNGNAWGQLPQISVDSRYGFTIGNPARFGQGSYPDERIAQAQETVSWVHGGLLMKAGFDLAHNGDATSLLRNQTGTYSYSSVENFVSDALAFSQFGFRNELDPYNQHTCDQTGNVWRDTTGQLRGLGALPCYSYYSQTIGPNAWKLSTNDWAGFATSQWQPAKLLVLSAGIRWEREQLPPPIPALVNPDLPLTAKLPSLGNNWGPRAGLALGVAEGHWPVLRLGYGMYFARTPNATVETALTRTGSPNGDLKFFIRPLDGYNSGTGTSDAQPFPYVLGGPPASEITPGAVEFAPNFRNPEVHQAVAAIEETMPGQVQVTASALMSLGRRLPISIDTNFDPKANPQTITYNVCDQTPTGPDNGQCGSSGLGPIKATQITVPFYASWPAGDCPSGSLLNLAGQCGRLNPAYQQIDQIMNRANSTYEAAMLRIDRYGRRGLSLHAHYTYAHAMDWNPNENSLVGDSVLDPADFSLEYGTSNLDVRHSAAVMAVWEAPWKLRGGNGVRSWAAQAANKWMVSGIGHYGSGLPYTMLTAGSLPEEFTATGTPIMSLEAGINGSGGDNRVYGVGNDNRIYNIGRNTFRYPPTWKADLRLGKTFDLGHLRQAELLAESFNLFNHQNVTELETTGYYIQSGSPPSELGAPATPPTLNFLTGLKINAITGLTSTAFGQPININSTNFYRERQIQLGVRIRF
jgi:hypothetical protein